MNTQGPLGPWDNGLRIRAFEEMWRGPGLSLIGMQLDFKGDFDGAVTGIAISHEGRNEHERMNAFAVLSMVAAKQLMDDLWRAGVRPTDAVSGDATTEATRKHLDDMRKLVAHYSKCGL